MKSFPVIVDYHPRTPTADRAALPGSVPWSLVAPWRAQAERNHGQTIERLAERGGMSPRELWCAAHGKGLSGVSPVSEADACAWLVDALAAHVRRHAEPPWSELDAGIRATVRALWDAGFVTTDSGDGSKAGAMECAIAVPHVFMRCEPAALVTEAQRLLALVAGWGEAFAPASADGPAVQACYLPADGVALLELYGRLVTP